MARYTKRDKTYEKVEFDLKSIKKSYEARKRAKKFPTSVSLPEEVVAELKKFAEDKGVPYQTLMRMLIVEGLQKLRKSA